ncbi:MAG: hypothetical protein RJA10_81 [Pseudomonadota bacterium]
MRVQLGHQAHPLLNLFFVLQDDHQPAITWKMQAPIIETANQYAIAKAHSQTTDAFDLAALG